MSGPHKPGNTHLTRATKRANILTMEMTLTTKQAPGYRTDDGRDIPEHTLYRFEDENGKGGCWYSTLAQAEQSRDRFVAYVQAKS